MLPAVGITLAVVDAAKDNFRIVAVHILMDIQAAFEDRDFARYLTQPDEGHGGGSRARRRREGAEDDVCRAAADRVPRDCEPCHVDNSRNIAHLRARAQSLFFGLRDVILLQTTRRTSWLCGR